MKTKSLFLSLAALFLCNLNLITASTALAQSHTHTESIEYGANSWIELNYNQALSTQFFIDEQTGNALPSWSGASTNYQISQPNFSGGAQTVLTPNFNLSYSSNASVAWPGVITEPIDVNTGADSAFFVDFYSESTEIPITFDYKITLSAERPMEGGYYDHWALADITCDGCCCDRCHPGFGLSE